MTGDRDKLLAILVSDALQREAVAQIARQKSLIDGRWVDASRQKAWRRVRIWRGLRETFEAVVFWGFVGLVGAALLALIPLVL